MVYLKMLVCILKCKYKKKLKNISSICKKNSSFVTTIVINPTKIIEK